jgi:hypothetical protein
MKTKLTISEITHDDLVTLLSGALYGSYKFGGNYSDDFYRTLPTASKEDCFEDKLAKILLAGGEIEIIDLYSECDEDLYGNNKRAYWDEEMQSMVYPITLEDIKVGLANAFNGDFNYCDEYNWVKNIVAEMCKGDDADYDKDDAETLLQIIIFGEVVY